MTCIAFKLITFVDVLSRVLTGLPKSRNREINGKYAIPIAGHMKFSGTHWKCIAQEFPMLFKFVLLIFTLAYLFNVLFTGEGASPLPKPHVSIQLAVRIEIIAWKFSMHFQCIPLIFTLAPTAKTVMLKVIIHERISCAHNRVSVKCEFARW